MGLTTGVVSSSSRLRWMKRLRALRLLLTVGGPGHHPGLLVVQRTLTRSIHVMYFLAVALFYLTCLLCLAASGVPLSTSLLLFRFTMVFTVFFLVVPFLSH